MTKEVACLAGFCAVWLLAPGCSRSELLSTPPADTPGAGAAGTGAAGVGGDGVAGSSTNPPFCGNGVVEAGEACDDGNGIPFDGCTPECLITGCGDGIVAFSEECDLGADNRDSPAFVLEQGSSESIALPVVELASVVDFYDYESKSAHTGFEEQFASRFFLFHSAQTQSLSLAFIHGIDIDSTGVPQPNSVVDFFIDGLPPGTGIELLDDIPQEFFLDSATTAIGAWEFSTNTDGGVLGSLAFPGAWEITVTPTFIAGVQSWSFIDGSLVFKEVALDQPVTLKSFAVPSQCRLDCTVPACGDGILDAGEVCDGPANGVGCAPDCQSLLF